MKRITAPLALIFFAMCGISYAEGPYQYPLVPGTAAWANATPLECFNSAFVPKAWREEASSHDLFLTAVSHPYFKSILMSGDTGISKSYSDSKSGPLIILTHAEQAPYFGEQAFGYLHDMNLPVVAAADPAQSNEPSWVEHSIVSHMAGLDASLNTMSQASMQTLFRLAVWDADYFISQRRYRAAAGSVRLMYIIYNKPVGFRGAFPTGVTLPTLTPDQSSALELGKLRPELYSPVASAKPALGLTIRP